MVLIIGGQGFIGINLSDYLKSINQRYISVDIKRLNNDSSLIVSKNPLIDINEILQNNTIDAVINCAGSAGVPMSIENPKLDFDLNVTLVNNLLILISKLKKKPIFVQLSSAAVYGNPDHLPINENDNLKPISPYGIHKRCAENLILDYNKLHKINFIIYRVFSCYGPGLKKQLFFDLYKRAINKPSEIKLFGTGNETRDFIFIEDLVQIISELIKNSNAFNRIINLSSGVETKISEVSELFLKNFGRPNIVFSSAKKKGDPENWRADISLLNSIIEFKFTDLETGLNKTANWLKESEYSV